MSDHSDVSGPLGWPGGADEGGSDPGAALGWPDAGAAEAAVSPPAEPAPVEAEPAPVEAEPAQPTSPAPPAAAETPTWWPETAAVPALEAAQAPAPAPPPSTVPKRRRSTFLRELPFLILIALVLALLIKAFVVQAFFIPSGSMQQTLHIGDRVLVNKVVYDLRSPHRGEVIVFKGPPSWAAEVSIAPVTNPVRRFLRDIGGWLGFAPANERDFIKRVIGVPGDTVACCDSQGRVTVNGVGLNEPYTYFDTEPPREQPFGPVKVPPGRLWVMGDHRDMSYDSRGHLPDVYQATIPIKDVIGRAFVIVWPLSRINDLPVPTTFHQKFTAAAVVGTPYLLGLVGAVPVTVLRRRLRGRRRARRRQLLRCVPRRARIVGRNASVREREGAEAGRAEAGRSVTSQGGAG